MISERNVSIQLARTIAGAAMECATEAWTLGGGGRPLRPDQACCCGATVRRRTAPSWRAARPTRPEPSGGSSLEWAKRSETDLVGQRSLAEVIPLGGGMPIKVGDEVIGAIGVSGTTGGQQGDEDCAKGAIAKVADQLK